jgi:hypothetical protein
MRHKMPTLLGHTAAPKRQGVRSSDLKTRTRYRQQLSLSCSIELKIYVDKLVQQDDN